MLKKRSTEETLQLGLERRSVKLFLATVDVKNFHLIKHLKEGKDCLSLSGT